MNTFFGMKITCFEIIYGSVKITSGYLLEDHNKPPGVIMNHTSDLILQSSHYIKADMCFVGEENPSNKICWLNMIFPHQMTYHLTCIAYCERL